MLIPFALGWAGGYLTWKTLVPTVCPSRKGAGLYGLAKKPRRTSRASRR